MNDRIPVELVAESAPADVAAPERSRAAFLRTAGFGGALLVGGALMAGLPEVSLAAPSPVQDRQIFNYALLLEYLQASFYAEAVSQGRLRQDQLQFARVAAGHEREHVALLKSLLGRQARKAPKFAFKGATSDPKRFVATAAVLEDLGVAAYNGQAVNLTKGGLAAAMRIVSVDARHAAWIRAIAGEPAASEPTDPGKTEREVLAAIGKLGVIR